ncbi:MAG TPA: hypothetical protein VE172_12465 [Stackebrandtia sp.]|jgi:hypothetical protein|uniref:hypothetical protein n=1 Tax=Stackebrandtia sp. TaxID=2023065 RepID=UPI002D22DA77|nr:hypothetical protein [Stackebrandtia sp.]HZE39615.1 hypothetical protein [Stackebrandtia sp.]
MYPNYAAAAELYARVEAACANTPYALTRTEDGFDLSVDIKQPQWQYLLYQRRVTQVFTHRVSVDEANKQLSISDQVRTVEWSTGVDGKPIPVLGANISVQSGRVIEVSSYKTLGGDGATTEYRFSSEEGRRLITEPAKQLGWSVTWPGSAKAALVIAVIGVVVALVAVVAVLLVAM